ncbi:MAG: glycine cleavage T C-terminal barrel domain-containing protein, partial [Actinomycetota bacterium]
AAPLQVQGPKSKPLMVKLLGEGILDLRYYFWRHAEIAGVPVVVTRTGWTSEVGYEVYTVDTSRGVEVYEAIMEAGREFNIRPTGPSDIRRIEGAIFNWGADMTYENDPIEMGLERLVDWSLEDGASISLAALRRIRDEGVTRRIVGVEFDGAPFEALNTTKWPVVEGEEWIGKVTSAIYSPRLEKNIGFAWVPTERSALGTRLTIQAEWGIRKGLVVEMPFVDPNKQIPVS